MGAQSGWRWSCVLVGGLACAAVQYRSQPLHRLSAQANGSAVAWHSAPMPPTRRSSHVCCRVITPAAWRPHAAGPCCQPTTPLSLPQLSDFGISAFVDNTLAQCHTFLGTVTYMSPERLEGKPYSFPADIWALGLTLLEAATGRYPYDARWAGATGTSGRWMEGGRYRCSASQGSWDVPVAASCCCAAAATGNHCYRQLPPPHGAAAPARSS